MSEVGDENGDYGDVEESLPARNTVQGLVMPSPELSSSRQIGFEISLCWPSPPCILYAADHITVSMEEYQMLEINH